MEMDTVARVPEELEVVWEGGSLVQKLDFWRIPFCSKRCRGMSHSKANCFKRGNKEYVENRVEDDEGDIVNGLNLLLPLDHNSTCSFVSKFANNVAMLLKFLLVDEILGFVSISDELY